MTKPPATNPKPHSILTASVEQVLALDSDPATPPSAGAQVRPGSPAAVDSARQCALGPKSLHLNLKIPVRWTAVSQAGFLEVQVLWGDLGRKLSQKCRNLDTHGRGLHNRHATAQDRIAVLCRLKL